jgi:hypothetical protein
MGIMASDDFRICGTARAEMNRIACDRAFKKALRAQARGRIAEAKALLAPLLPEWVSQTIPLAAAEHAQAAILFASNDTAESERLREKSLVPMRDWANELDASLERAGRETSDHLMWLARLKVQRGLAAYLLGDYRGAETVDREAIAMLSSIWGADHLEVGTYEDDLATVLLRVGRESEAESLIAHAQAIKAKHGSRYDTE